MIVTAIALNLNKIPMPDNSNGQTHIKLGTF